MTQLSPLRVGTDLPLASPDVLAKALGIILGELAKLSEEQEDA
jgi:hypothetical protein